MITVPLSMFSYNAKKRMLSCEASDLNAYFPKALPVQMEIVSHHTGEHKIFEHAGYDYDNENEIVCTWYTSKEHKPISIQIFND